MVVRTTAFSILFLLLGVPTAKAQISPGELSHSHEQLEGVDNCTQCHERGKETSDAKCLACHDDIRESRDAGQGFHVQHRSEACVSCHKEHLGRDAHITMFDTKTFDHTKTSFLLSGKHAAATCEECHTAANIKSQRVQRSLKQHPRQTFLGLLPQCNACHQDRHGGTLGTNCQTCHDAKGWTPAPLFSHAKTKYPLAGKHAELRCVQCHESFAAREKGKPLLFAVKEFSDCKSCHKSPHSEKFSQQSCRSCHTTAGWKVVTAFNHAATAFPLIGKHATVACTKCHTEMERRATGEQISFTTKSFRDCTPCHTTPHSASFSRQTCSSCHTAIAWNAIRGKSFDHNLTSFPLRGKHAVTKCEQCHKQQGKEILKISAVCASCHEDVHRGEFTQRFRNDCSRCHNEQTFRPATFTIEQHRESRFALTEAHRAIPCRDCHVRDGKLVFAFETVRCESCHKDRHNGQFAAMMRERSCDACHSTAFWKIDTFDHSVTGFALDGKHSTVACAGCHKTDAFSKVTQYKGVSRECSGCHEDAHVGQFAANGTTDCARCHTPRSWNVVLFHHDTQSKFPLTGAHRNVDCRGCHKLEERGGKKFVRFKPVPTECESCHQKGTKS